ncbi:MAG: hypothetical protein ABIT83_14105 [Massilia sp.]
MTRIVQNRLKIVRSRGEIVRSHREVVRSRFEIVRSRRQIVHSHAISRGIAIFALPETEGILRARNECFCRRKFIYPGRTLTNDICEHGLSMPPPSAIAATAGGMA